MGLLDTIEGIAGGQLGSQTDEDHVEDALDSAEDLLDDAGGLLDDVAGAQKALGGGSDFNPITSAASKVLGGVADAVDKVNNVVGGLLGEQDGPAVLPQVQYRVSKLTAPQPFQDPSLLGSLGGATGLEHMADNAIGMLGGPSGLVKSGAALLGDLGTASTPDVPEWWVHEFHCTETLNDLFELTVFLVRRESTNPSDTTPPTPQSTIDGLLGGGPLNIGQAIATGTTLERDVGKALKRGSGNDQDLLDDLTRYSDPATAFFDHVVQAAPLNPDDFLETTRSIHLQRTMIDGSVLTDRWFTGICTEFEDLGYIAGGADAGVRMIRLVIRPSLWKLSLQTNCRIFQGQNVISIVKKVFAFSGIYQLSGNVLTVPPSVVPGIPIAVSEDAWLPKREYCVQYNETDLAFVQRLLAEEGVSFHFDHQEAAERIVLLDNAKGSSRKCKTIDGKPASITDNGFVGSDGLEHVWNYGARNRLMPPRVTLRDFNLSIPDTPTEALFGVSPTSALTNPSLGSITDALGGLVSKALGSSAKDYGIDAEHYEYPGRFTLEPDTSDPHHTAYKRYSGANVARYYNKMYRGQTEVCEGSSNLVNLIAGGSLRLFTTLPVEGANAPAAAQYRADRVTRAAKRGQKLIMTQVVHTGVIDTTPGSGSDAQSSPSYFNTFSCVVSQTTPIKPPPRPPKPVIAGVQTATVVDPHVQGETATPDGGDATSEHAAVCDDLGRVCVRFHWDRRDVTDGSQTDVMPGTAASAFLRVAQALAGAQWGVQFVPRIGMEVAVGFLEGDPDRPVILGALYAPPPSSPAFPPRKNAEEYTYSGIVTQSFPADPAGPRHNQLIFKDVGGSEEIHLRAQRMLREQVHGDYTTVVGKDLTNEVWGDQTEDVLRNQALTVNGRRLKTVVGKEVNDIGGGLPAPTDPSAVPEVVRDTQIHGNQQFNTAVGDRTQRVKEWDSLAVDGGGPRAATDGAEAIGLYVRGHQHTDVLVDDRLVVAGDRHVTVDGAYVARAAALDLGSQDDSGGTGLHSTPQGARLDAQSRLVVHANANIDVTADIQDDTKGIEIVGTSGVHITSGTDEDHCSVTLDEAGGRVYLRGRDEGVRLQWGDDVYLEVKPTAFTLAAGKAKFTVQGSVGAGFTAEFTTPGTLDFAFRGEMHVDGNQVDAGLTSAVDPSAPPDPSNKGQLLIEDGTDPNTERAWDEKFKTVSDSTNADATNAHFDADGSSTKKYTPPPDGTPPVGGSPGNVGGPGGSTAPVSSGTPSAS